MDVEGVITLPLMWEDQANKLTRQVFIDQFNDFTSNEYE
jgi:hypothetical protein